MDAVGQPIASAGIEVLLWFAVFRVIEGNTLGGYGLDAYLAYAIWSSFAARVSSNWMYEFRMIEDISMGTLNSLLARPVSFFESYLSQFLGYKFMTALLSWWVPMLVIAIFDLPILWHRLPKVFLTLAFFLVFLQILSFIVSTFAFHMTRVASLTVAKNLLFWLLSGELIPLDLAPEPYRSWLLALPFCNAVYIPVGYLTGRVSDELWLQGLYSIAGGIAVFSLIAFLSWRKGIREYVGTGA